MTKALVPHITRSGETFDPDRINENFDAMARNLEEVVSRRYSHSAVRREFKSLSETSQGGRFQFRIKPPWDLDLLAVEIIAWGTDGAKVTVSAPSGVTGWKNRSVTMKGSTTIARFEGLVAAPSSAYISSGDTAVFQIDCDTTPFTINRLDLILHVRTDQHEDGRPTFTPPGVKTADANDPAVLNTAYSEWATAWGLENTRTQQKRISVVEISPTSAGSFPAHSSEVRMPQAGGRLHQVQSWLLPAAAATRACDIDVTDEGGTIQQTITYTVASSSSHREGTVTVNDTQEDEPFTATKDWYMDINATSGAGEIEDIYAVLFYD